MLKYDLKCDQVSSSVAGSAFQLLSILLLNNILIKGGWSFSDYTLLDVT